MLLEGVILEQLDEANYLVILLDKRLTFERLQKMQQVRLILNCRSTLLLLGNSARMFIVSLRFGCTVLNYRVLLQNYKRMLIKNISSIYS